MLHKAIYHPIIQNFTILTNTLFQKYSHLEKVSIFLGLQKY